MIKSLESRSLPFSNHGSSAEIRILRRVRKAPSRSFYQSFNAFFILDDDGERHFQSKRKGVTDEEGWIPLS